MLSQVCIDGASVLTFTEDASIFKMEAEGWISKVRAVQETRLISKTPDIIKSYVSGARSEEC